MNKIPLSQIVDEAHKGAIITVPARFVDKEQFYSKLIITMAERLKKSQCLERRLEIQLQNLEGRYQEILDKVERKKVNSNCVCNIGATNVFDNINATNLVRQKPPSLNNASISLLKSLIEFIKNDNIETFLQVNQSLQTMEIHDLYPAEDSRQAISQFSLPPDTFWHLSDCTEEKTTDFSSEVVENNAT